MDIIQSHYALSNENKDRMPYDFVLYINFSVEDVMLPIMVKLTGT